MTKNKSEHSKLAVKKFNNFINLYLDEYPQLLYVEVCV